MLTGLGGTIWDEADTEVLTNCEPLECDVLLSVTSELLIFGTPLTDGRAGVFTTCGEPLAATE